MACKIPKQILILYLGLPVFISAYQQNSLENCTCDIDTVQETADCSFHHLSYIPDCIPDTIQSLNLSSTNLIFKPRQFQRFRNLSRLDVSNIFRSPVKDTFVGLSNLKYLYMNENHAHYFEPGVFTGLQKLEKLYMYGITFIIFANNQFNELSGLKFLDLSRYYLLLNLNNRTFSGLSSLKYLSLKNSGWFFHFVPVDVFLPLTGLEELHLEGLCYAIVFDKFQNCSMISTYLSKVRSLKRLYLPAVVLKNPLGQGFSALNRLEQLHFTYAPALFRYDCSIHTLDNRTFQNLRESPVLNLTIKHCFIEHVMSFVFTNFKHLQSLDLILLMKTCDIYFFNKFAVGLNHTNIRRLRLSLNCLFEYMKGSKMFGLSDTMLEHLDLSEGPIEIIGNEFMSHLPKTLSELSLQRNKIFCVEPGSFGRLQNLTHIDLSNQADIKHEYPRELPVYCQDKILSAKLPFEMKRSREINRSRTDAICNPLPFSLLSLDLSKSGLLSMMLKGFCGSKFSIKLLNVSYQKDFHFNISSLFWKTLKTLNTLEVLDLSGNNLRRLPYDAFSGQKNLIDLNLSGNLLIEISFDIMPLLSLKHIDVSSNTIQYASKEFTKQSSETAKFPNLTIFLENNRLICDCQRMYFVAWMQGAEAIFREQSPTCKFKNETEVGLAQISKIHYLLASECVMIEVIVSSIVGFVLLHLLLFIIALFWHNRWKIKYLSSVGRYTINPYHPLEDRKIQMEYDIYISYERDCKMNHYDTLHDFVTQIIYPAMKRKGFNVLIREELDIGMRLYDVISKAIRKCDKVLVLLSKGYCSDYWNVFEFNTAAMEGIYTKRQVIIPIAFEPFSEADLHEEIHTFLSSSPVPKYTEAVTVQVLTDYLCKRMRENRPLD